MNVSNLKQKEDFRNSILLLGSYLESYESGNTLMYLPMAVELRKLLCEKQSPPLIERIIPEIKLHKLHSTELFENNPGLLSGLQNFMPGRLTFHKGNLPTFHLLFSRSRESIDLYQWISQNFFKEGITICELIKSVADKQAAHADRNYNDTLLHCREWVFNDVGCHVLGIYSIARYLYDIITMEHKESLQVELK